MFHGLQLRIATIATIKCISPYSADDFIPKLKWLQRSFFSHKSPDIIYRRKSEEYGIKLNFNILGKSLVN